MFVLKYPSFDCKRLSQWFVFDSSLGACFFGVTRAEKKLRLSKAPTQETQNFERGSQQNHKTMWRKWLKIK